MKPIHTNDEDLAVFTTVQVAMALLTIHDHKMGREEVISLKNTYRQTLSNPTYFKDSYTIFNALITQPDEKDNKEDNQEN